MANTIAVRAWLPALVKELGIAVLLDAPCGDCNWIKTVNLGCTYIGVDNDQRNLEIAHGLDVRCLDIVTDKLPLADMLLCRDCLQHLPNKMVRAFLENFVSSGIAWLVATTYRAETNTDITMPGGFHPVNLCKSPFNLPAPRQVIDDGGHDLALWHRDDLRC